MLTITTAAAGEGVIEVCIAGEVDTATVGQLADAAHDAIAVHPREVHLNKAAVTFLDSSGISTLLRVRHDAAEQAVALRVVKAHRRVAKILDLTGLSQLLQDGNPPLSTTNI